MQVVLLWFLVFAQGFQLRKQKKQHKNWNGTLAQAFTSGYY